MHQPDIRKRRVVVKETDAAFDAFDEEAQELVGPPDSADRIGPPDSHGHFAVPTSYPSATGRWLGLSIGLLAVVLVVAFALVQQLKMREESGLREQALARTRKPAAVEIVRVQKMPPLQILTLPGETRGWYNSTIYARVTGYVAKWLVDIGDVVRKDQVMAVIDTPDLDAQLAAGRAQLEASEAEAKVKDTDVEFAKSTHDRWQTSPKGAVSDQEREDKKAHYQRSLAALNAAHARVDLDRANVDRLNFLTNFKQVLAPYDCIVTDRRIDIGDLVTAGSNNTTPLFGISHHQQIRVFTNVPQSARIDLGVGVAAQITAAELPNRIFKGVVARTSQSVDPRARTIRVEIDLDNEDLSLVPGLYVQVTFDVRSRPSVQVPASAMLFRGAGPQVALIGDGDTVTFRDVGIGRDDGKFVEIATGLSEGDRVALNISNQIAEGEKVSVKETQGSDAKPAK
jgi:RND family efflux transporter MFP subunit